MKLTDFRDYTEICTIRSFIGLCIKNIYANDGSMTAGADGTTIDGMGNKRIERIILSLKDRSYQPKPARREYIAKKKQQ